MKKQVQALPKEEQKPIVLFDKARIKRRMSRSHPVS